MSLKTVAIVLLAFGASLVAQEELAYVADAPGKVSIIVERGTLSQHRVAAPEVRRFYEGLERVRDLVALRPFLQQLRGVEIRGYMREEGEPGLPAEPVPGFGFIQYYPIVVSPKSGSPERFLFSTWQIAVGINAPCSGLARAPVNPNARIYVEPQPAGTVGGVRAFTVEHGSELIVFTRNGRLPWVPVTREEYAAIWIANWKAQAAKMPPAGAAMMQRGLIDKLEAAMRALTPEQRRMQARSHMEVNGPEVAIGSPLVKPDPDWFDPALPRTAMQVISLKFDYSGNLDFERPEATQNLAALRVYETLHRSTWTDLGTALAR